MNEFINCHKCRDYRKCPYFQENAIDEGKDFYNFAEIRWCPYQVMWILENSEILRAGGWPKELSSDNEGRKTIKTEATFVKPTIVIAEVDERLKRTGVAGKLLYSNIKARETFNTLDIEAKEALMYVKGWRRKRIDFKKWLRDVYYRPKSGEKHQLTEAI